MQPSQQQCDDQRLWCVMLVVANIEPLALGGRREEGPFTCLCPGGYSLTVLGCRLFGVTNSIVIVIFYRTICLSYLFGIHLLH